MGNYVFLRHINVFGTACGDGRKSPSEACDDGNSVSGDGCSEVCKVEDGWVCTHGTERHPDSCKMKSKVAGKILDSQDRAITIATAAVLQGSELTLSPVIDVDRTRSQEWLVEGGHIMSAAQPEYAVTAGVDA